MPTAGLTHHIVLNGVGYMLLQHPDGRGLAYQRGERPYFSARFLTSGNRREGQSRPGQDNDGFVSGVQLAFGAGGYARGKSIDARTGDGLRIAAKLEGVTSGGVELNDLVDFNATAYGAGENGLIKYSVAGNSFSTIGSATARKRLLAYGNVMWVLTSGATPVICSTSDSLSNASGSNAGTPAGGGRTGVWTLNLSPAGSVRYLLLAGNAAGMPSNQNFTQIAETGDPRAAARNYMVAIGEDLYFGKDDGLYQAVISSDGLSITLTRVDDYSAAAATDNSDPIASFGGYIYYRVRDRLRRYKTSVEDVTPPPTLVGSGGPATVRHSPVALAASSRWLFCLTKSDEATPALELWATDGARWEHLHRVHSASGVAGGALLASANANRLLINYYDGSAWTTKKMDLRSDSDLPAAVFDTTSNYVYLAPIDGGLPDLTKRWRSVVVRGDLSATNSVTVEYWTGSAWTSLGTLTAEGAVSFATTVTGTSLWLRLELKGSSTTTPVVREVGVNFDYLPGPLKRVTFTALLANNLRLLDGTTEANSPTTLLANLDTARAAGTVVTLTDPVTSATGAGALTVRVLDVAIKALTSLPNASNQYGWLCDVECEIL